MREMKKAYKILVGKPELEDLGVDVRIVLKCVLKSRV
jgi:hypothetical protein